MPRILHWFRHDLRILDNPALSAAATESQGDVISCFCIAEVQWLTQDMAPIQADFICRTLENLRAQLRKRGIPLYLIRCESFDPIPDELIALANERHCEAIFFNEEYGVNERQRDKRLEKASKITAIKIRKFRDQSIVPVGQIRTQQGAPYTVFTPFKRTWWVHLNESALTLWHEPWGNNAALCDSPVNSISLELIPFRDSSAYLSGEDSAHRLLESFVETRAKNYQKHRDIPAINGTSHLSPYLALGVLSGKQCFRAALQQRESKASFQKGLDCWINELIWRDFYINILYEFPRISKHKAFKVETEALSWRESEADFLAWCEGRTGIPLVDAAMRQLNQTGWMHNRLRMVCAMFLTKNLLLNWRKGERYFMQNLIDGYLPANNGGWQWSASTGTDAAPYFRIFNPVSQGKRFDPEGEFIRTFVPELKNLPNQKIHQPLEKTLTGIDYPAPIVDLKSSRQRAIEAFKALKH